MQHKCPVRSNTEKGFKQLAGVVAERALLVSRPSRGLLQTHTRRTAAKDAPAPEMLKARFVFDISKCLFAGMERERERDCTARAPTLLNYLERSIEHVGCGRMMTTVWFKLTDKQDNRGAVLEATWGT